jgi:putative hydroxymethylpyrimidine transport system ATP-binding protein
MLEFKRVSFHYGNSQDLILKELSFKVAEGEFISIIGKSGCGKSTIFRLLNGLEKAYTGQILYNGESIGSQRNYCAFMPQKDLLFPWRRVIDNVSLPMEIQGVSKKERRQKSLAMLREVGLEDYQHKYPRELSGGMRQRISFARTLCTGSSLLLLDEPLSALDSITRASLQEWLLAQYYELNKTILFVTHDVEEAIFLSKRIYVVNERPISSLQEITIDFPYPRIRDMLALPEIAELKIRLLRSLEQEVVKIAS